jgi:hypothetical protein
MKDKEPAFLSEPALIFSASDGNSFFCSACRGGEASAESSRFIVAGISDLVRCFQKHVQESHPHGTPENSGRRTCP